ncbi:MAG: hypothetical protein GY866_22610 [Proteobacteria bacterium]|nr:hypothetical protein [Pseudomonadota bacterium]
MLRGRVTIKPVSIRGSGDFSNFERSHGLIKFPAEKNKLETNSIVEFLPWGELW